MRQDNGRSAETSKGGDRNGCGNLFNGCGNLLNGCGNLFNGCGNRLNGRPATAAARVTQAWAAARVVLG